MTKGERAAYKYLLKVNPVRYKVVVMYGWAHIIDLQSRKKFHRRRCSGGLELISRDYVPLVSFCVVHDPFYTHDK